MGDYNSYAPQILGQEWVPIRDEDQTFSPAVNAVEIGHGFTTTAARTLTTGRFYVHTLPPAQTQGQVYEVAVYARGTEDQSGPIRSVIIPCNSGGVTGAGFNSLSAANIPIFLASPSDSGFIECTPNADTNSKTLDLFFATSSYTNLLTGKRILGVNLLHSFSWQPFEAGVAGSIATPPIQFSPSQALELWTGTGFTRAAVFAPIVETYGSNLLALNPPVGRPPQAIPLSRVRLGEVDHFWQTPSTTITSERAPWRYTELARFEATSGSNRIRVHYDFGGAAAWAGVFYLGYAALEVIYCEEQRVAHGLTSLSDSFAGSTAVYTLGANLVTMRDPATLAVNPVLATGDYTTVVSCPDIGDLQGAQAAQQSQPAAANTYAALNAVRQLYQIPAHPGVKVQIPFPLEDHLGETFTAVETDVLPQISLHVAGGTITEPHAYGRQVAAQVYSTINATQSIDDTTIITSATNFPQVRFYARRFGDTTIPLKFFRTSTPTQQVSISPAEFDELAEIVDGWKEVTLRFSTVPSFSGSGPNWQWTATNETAGNRWEVLGACAPAISGTPGNQFNLVPAPNTLTNATYLAPNGATVTLDWAPQGIGSPYVTVSVSDATSDATLIFSQDPPTITGVSLTQATQAVTGIGFDCGSLPCCIPSGIGYNQLAWSAPLAVLDTFSRVVAAGWGSADTGQAWSVVDGAAADFSVNGSTGLQTHPILATNHSASINVGTSDQDVTIYFKLPALLTGTGAQAIVDLRARYTDANNHYRIRATIDSSAAMLFTVTSRAGGTSIQIGTTPTLTHFAADWYGMRLSLIGSDIRAKAWNATVGAEPDWQLEIQDAAVPAAVGVNVFSFLNASVTNTLPFAFAFDNFMSVEAFGGAYEIQRLDTTDFDWQTIMLATDPRVQAFKDYEARVGINSVYRIRNLNVYNFAGAWSTQVTGAPPTPGVTGGCGGDATGALIFTSNADQTGGSNAAYVMQWEGEPIEDFTLPEGDSVTFQPMYGRDGSVAFHGTERALETFSRTLLIQAAAIDPVRLADTTTLRDLAWADLPYVCVRDDIGDRWFANVRVPAVNARLNRTKYMARVDVVEVTTMPAAVDP